MVGQFLANRLRIYDPPRAQYAFVVQEEEIGQRRGAFRNVFALDRGNHGFGAREVNAQSNY